MRLMGDYHNCTLQHQKDNPFISCGLAEQIEHIIIVWLYENGTWYYYNPAIPYEQNTLHQLEVGKNYQIYVDCDCRLEYGDRFYYLFTGWNNITWLGYD
jgi:hypothetical protein